MPTVRTHFSSFAAGELTPELFGRMDLNKRQAGLALARNYITLPHGPAQNRTGTRFVSEAGASTAVRLIPFSYNNQQTFAIEMGPGYFRFHTQAATLQYSTVSVPTWVLGGTLYSAAIVQYGGHYYYTLSAGVAAGEPRGTMADVPPGRTDVWHPLPDDGTYEVPNPYTADELFDVHYVQSADVLTLVHPNHPPMELRRYGATSWTFGEVSFASRIAPPTSTLASPSVGGAPAAPYPITVNGTTTVNTYNTDRYAYVVTSVGVNGAESAPHSSSVYTASWTSGSSQPPTLPLSWAHVAGAYRYRVYRGLYPTIPAGFKYIGEVVADVDLTTITFNDNSFDPPLPYQYPPSSGGGGSGTPTLHTYVVTSISASDNQEESLASSPCSTSIDLTVSGQTVKVTWANVSGALRYNIYKYSNGIYGYIGQGADGAGGFIDDNITADISQTPPELDDSFSSGTGTYPAAVGYFEQRRAFAGWSASPQSLLATRSGTESSVSFHIPSQADDRLALRIAAREASAIRHIVPVQDVMLLTASNEFRMYASDSNAISAANVTVKPQSYVGANNVQPCVVSNSILYAAAWGGHVREMSYNWQAQSYLTGDISLLAKHLFDYREIVDMAFVKAPTPILWCVNNAGLLLGLTYVPEQQVSAWHQHVTVNGAFESCCAVAENGEEMLYVVVRRTIDGVTKRYVEVLASRNFTDQADAFFVDCGLTYTGTATDTITGLDHLEGQTVAVLGDGGQLPNCTVTGGTIHLQHAVSKVQVGLPITADLQTLPLVYQATDFGAGRVKNLNKAYLRVVSTVDLAVGPAFDQLTPAAQRTDEPYGTPTAAQNAELEVVLDNNWGTDGTLCARHTAPLPVTIVSVAVEAAVGG